MKQRIIHFMILPLLLSALYAEVLPSQPYELTKEKHSELSQLIADAGYTQKVCEITADRYENNDIIINVELEPTPKNEYKEKVCLTVDYSAGKMKISNAIRMVNYDSTGFYFPVESDVNDTVIESAVEKYLSIMKYKKFPFIKLGKIRCLYEEEYSYALSIVIQEEYRYAFTLILDKKTSNLRKIEIEPLPML